MLKTLYLKPFVSTFFQPANPDLIESMSTVNINALIPMNVVKEFLEEGPVLSMLFAGIQMGLIHASAQLVSKELGMITVSSFRRLVLLVPAYILELTVLIPVASIRDNKCAVTTEIVLL